MIGTTFGGKYTIVQKLGEGGMGAVYEARHTGTGRRVAIKVITGHLAQDEKLVARFELEAKAAGAIESDNIVQILDVGHDEQLGAPFLAMEYLVGEDLGRLFARTGPLAPEATLRIALQACNGLAQAHARGIVHRDIKPANLFLTERDGGELRVKVLDFGIAKVQPDALGAEVKAPLTRTGSLLGSPLYMSPEQARGKGRIDHRTDIWSLGIVMYQALTGRTPLHDAESLGDFIFAVCSTPPAPIRSIAPWVDPAVAAAVERALVIDPAQRYQTVTELRDALAAQLPQDAPLRASMLVAAGATPAPASAPSPGPATTAPMDAPAPPAPAPARPTWAATDPAQIASPVQQAPRPAQIVLGPVMPPAPPPAHPRTGKGWLVAVASGLALIVIGGGVVYALGWIGAPAESASAVSPAVSAAPSPPAAPAPTLTVGKPITPVTHVDAGTHGPVVHHDAGTPIDAGGPIDAGAPPDGGGGGRWPGAHCDNDAQCMSQSCVAGRCKLPIKGLPCVSDAQCGSRKCTGGVCQ